ncbi:MAG: uroporphyrinogen decarboxylase family protein [Dehalococcoidia bacterium]|nr:uroporphyrinogen decarboxylase family protein [Dehalococcoidia bacterium]MDP7240718.1 uroporphyrinogen decarboxylase family protein [Dehalococcoidia bacterium]MDP7470131.1 uroporphyrinogen decarboxylase family protein [Dehalococcoidia bacterium]
MAEFTGKQRVRAAYRREFADRVPFYPILGHCNASLAGINIKDYLTNPRKCVEAQVRGYEKYKPDIVVMVGDLLKEAEAMGNVLKFPEDSICISERVALEDKSNLGKLRVPNPSTDGRLPTYLEMCRLAKEQLKDASVGGNVCGPWTIAISLRDAESLLKDCRRDPEFVHALMELTTEVSHTSALALATTGVGVSIGEPTASCSLISPRLYREFIFPYHQRLFTQLRDAGLGLTIHVCGYADPILEDLIETGVDAISIDFPSSLEQMVGLSSGKVVVIGNVNTRLFYTGTKEEMEAEVKRCIDTAAKGSRFILSTGCEVPGIATEERIRWFMEAGEKYGAYPAPAVA